MKYNWNEIQKYYDLGNTWRDLTEKFGVRAASLHKAKKSGRFISRSQSDSLKLALKKKPRLLSTETKKKISESRIKYLKENPEKVPYRINHSSKKSWPEIVFENGLNSMGITGWVSRYRNSIYEYDFAWLKEKIDVEIDGGTHKTEKVKKIDSRRDEFSRQDGWLVVRFDAERVKKDVIGCLNELKTIILTRQKNEV
jgi:very-short-patch-repair endonuclease